MQKAMQNLAQEIQLAHRARTTGLGSLQRRVSAQKDAARGEIQGFKASRRASAQRLASEMAKGREQRAKDEDRRKSGVKLWLAGLSDGRRASPLKSNLAQARIHLTGVTLKLLTDAQESLKKTGTARADMSKHLREDLARGVSNLRQSDAQRTSNTRTWLRNVAEGQRDSAQRLKDSLARGRAQRASAEAQRASDTQKLLTGIASARGDSAQRLRDELALSRERLAELIAQKRSSIAALMDGIARDHAAAKQAWMQIAVTLRGPGAVELAPKQVAPVSGFQETPKASTEASPSSPEEEDEGEFQDQVEDKAAAERSAAVRGQVFAYLADHPDGVRLAEIQREVGLSRADTTRATKTLMREGKAKKLEHLFFAT